MVHLVVVIFCLTNIPELLLIVAASTKKADEILEYYYTDGDGLMLAKHAGAVLNSSLNFFVYVSTGPAFRLAVGRLFRQFRSKVMGCWGSTSPGGRRSTIIPNSLILRQ